MKNVKEVKKLIEDNLDKYYESKKVVFRVYEEHKSIEITPQDAGDILAQTVVEAAFYAAMLNGMGIYISQRIIDDKSFPAIILY